MYNVDDIILESMTLFSIEDSTPKDDLEIPEISDISDDDEESNPTLDSLLIDSLLVEIEEEFCRPLR